MNNLGKFTIGILGTVFALGMMGFTTFAGDLTDKITVSKDGAYTDVQSAIDAVDDGGVVIVEKGEYYGPFKIDGKNIKIVGEDGTVFTFDGEKSYDINSGINLDSVYYAGVIIVNNSSNTIIENIDIIGDIDVASENTSLTYDAIYSGIAVINSNVKIKNCKVKDITYKDNFKNVQNGFGIYAFSESSKEIDVINTDIEAFNKTAIYALPETKLNMDGCTIIGFGEQDFVKQSGIQYYGDAKIVDCVIEQLRYVTNDEWSGDSTAIYNSGMDNTTTIKDVKTKNVDSAVYTYSEGKMVIESGEFDGSIYSEYKDALLIRGGKFANDISDYIDKGRKVIKDKDGNFVVTKIDNSDGNSNSDNDKDDKVHSYELEEGKVDRNDDKDEPVVTPEPEEEGPFSDVGKDNPNYDAIIKVYENGWMEGIGEGVFAPNGTLTRAMGAMVLWNKAGNPEPQNVAPFLDVTADAWYAKAVAWAYEQGIIAGYDAETFGPDDALTTEQFTRMNDIATLNTPAEYIGGAPNATRGWVASLLAI